MEPDEPSDEDEVEIKHSDDVVKFVVEITFPTQPLSE
jgi:hypothetical protein